MKQLLSLCLALLLLASYPAWAEEATANHQDGAVSSETKDAAEDPWGSSTETAVASNDWQAELAAKAEEPAFDPLDPFQHAWVPLDSWVEQGIGVLVSNFRPLFQIIRAPVEVTLNALTSALQSIPSSIMVVLLTLVAWQLVSGRMALGTLVSLIGIGLIGAWADAMVTLSLVLTSLFFCILIGLPAGILLARSEKATTWTRPLLDAMQTTPAFVYLIPIVMLFGIGNVPGVVVTIIFALPPMIRLTILGIRQVPEDLIEAGNSFGPAPPSCCSRCSCRSPCPPSWPGSISR